MTIMRRVEAFVLFLSAIYLALGVSPAARAQSTGDPTVPGRARLIAEAGARPTTATHLAIEPPTRAATESTLANGHVLFIESRTEYLHASLLEEKLMARPEFARLGLAITRQGREADLYVVVERAIFTTKFTYTVMDQSTHVLATGQVNSLFGTASGKIAKKLLSTLTAARRPQP